MSPGTTQADLHALEENRFLMSAYAKASDGWHEFRAAGRTSGLVDAASTLSGAWTMVSQDDDFFAALATMPTSHRDLHDLHSDTRDGLGSYRAKGEGLMLRTDRILARELVVLTEAGMEPAHAMRLVTDLGQMMGEEVEAPSKAEMETLQSGAKALAADLCDAQKTLRALGYEPAEGVPAAQAPHGRWMKARTTGKALGATAGVAGVAGNVAGAVLSLGVLSGLGLASVLLGAKAAAMGLADRMEDPAAKGKGGLGASVRVNT